jgi:hypothetical protein
VKGEISRCEASEVIASMIHLKNRKKATETEPKMQRGERAEVRMWS